MTKEERGKLLRQRFKGFPFVFSGVRKPKPVPRPKPTRIVMGWPEANKDTRRAGVWMHKADPKPKIVPRPKRNAGTPALTKIAQKAPKKLVRTYRNAEEMLAARARR